MAGVNIQGNVRGVLGSEDYSDKASMGSDFGRWHFRRNFGDETNQKDKDISTTSTDRQFCISTSEENREIESLMQTFEFFGQQGSTTFFTCL